MNTLRRILVLVRKELQTLLGDRQGRLLLVMPVILQMALFPLAATLEVKNATLAVYDRDGGPAAIELVQRLGSARRTFAKILFLRSEAELTRAIEEQQALAAVRIPPDFSRRVARGDAPQLQIVLDGRRSNSGQIVAGYLRQIAAGLAAGDAVAVVAGPAAQDALAVRNWFNPNLDYLDFVLPCLIAIITTVGVLVVTALSVAREREQGTFDQLLVSPFTPEMIMAGKIAPAVLVAAFQATLILLAAVFVYRVPFQGSLLMLYGGILLYALALAGVGLFISSVCATQQQAFLGMFSFMMPAIMLSGFAAPVENMPVFLQHVSWFNPIRHFMEVVKAVYLKNATPAHVAELAWPLLVIGAATLTAAGVVFRRKAT
ncbi:ABC-type multidrug transport system, permease component [Opitutaceae bacterium TAV1]|nr:ABC-type multidrug transport system, permease component [Opitutaceae bacterium TAV1]